MRGPIAQWNPARGVWETGTPNILCEHLVPFLETWPASGSMRNGSVSGRPPADSATTGNGFSSLPGPLLRTPTAQLAVNGGSQHPDKRRAGGHGETLADQIEHMLPTPEASDWKGSGVTQGRMRDGRPRTPGDMDLPEAVSLISAGESTSPRSAGRKRRSAGQLPGQLSLDELDSG